MNHRQKEVEKAKLAEEMRVLQTLKKEYMRAADDIAHKITFHQDKIDIIMEEWDKVDEGVKSLLQSQIYQKQYQEALKQQIDAILENMNINQYKTIDDYLKGCYKAGYVGSMYDLAGQGIPIIAPINQKAMVQAAKLDSKISHKLYGTYTEELKKQIRAEVSRGVASNQQFKTIARNLNMQTNIGLNKAMRIVRTEGHAVQIQAAVDAQYKAKEAGADVLKEWNSTMDRRTRASHRMLDGEIRELHETFSNGMKYPSDPAGGAAEVINCRCALLQRARWAMDEDELKARAEYFGLTEEKAQTFVEFKKRFLALPNDAMASMSLVAINKMLNAAPATATKQTGGRYGETLLETYVRKSTEAGTYYAAAREADDVAAVAAASGMTTEEIKTIKNHIFFDEHIMYDGTVSTFDPDYEMAIAWKRLSEGRPEERDLLLLKHEMLESQYEKEYNMTASEAHEMANKTYNWEKTILDMFGEEGEVDDLL